MPSFAMADLIRDSIRSVDEGSPPVDLSVAFSATALSVMVIILSIFTEWTELVDAMTAFDACAYSRDW